MYGVSLANDSGVFDSESGFETIQEAMRWAAGRGGTYHVMIDGDQIADGEYPLVEDYWVYPSTVKTQRMRRDMTQRELAEATCINIRQIQKFESGEYKVANMAAKTLLAIADVLEVDPHDLI